MKTTRQPRGIRNNNPLNLRKSKNAWLGKIVPGSDPEFEQFVDMLHGIRAAFINTRTILKRNPNCTLEKFISIWAPATENNTTAYIIRVSDLALIGARAQLDFSKANQMQRLLWAMAFIECGCRVDFNLFKSAYEML